MVNPETGMITIDVIRVADVSGDLRTVTKIYPDETVDAQIRIPFRSSSARFRDIFEQICFLNDMKDKSGCNNSYWNMVTQFF
jgi:hypothetical protein